MLAEQPRQENRLRHLKMQNIVKKAPINTQLHNLVDFKQLI